MMKPKLSENVKARKSRLDDLLDFEVNDHAEWLRHKREDAAIALTGMLHAAGMSRADLARRLDWKASRVTRALSGNENLTINTLAEIINAAGMDFDVMLRSRTGCRALQPWEGANIGVVILGLHDQVVNKLNDAKNTCVEAKAVLNSANELVRAAFRHSGQRRAQLAVPKLPEKSYQYVEEENAPVRRQA